MCCWCRLQHDNHIPNLSVAETVNFAHTCHSGFGEPEFNLPGELCKAKVCERLPAATQPPRCVLLQTCRPAKNVSVWPACLLHVP